MLLSFSAPYRLHLLPSLTHYQFPKIKRNPNFPPEPPRSSRLCTSHRLFCHRSTRSEDAKLLEEAVEAIDGSPSLDGDRLSVAVGSPIFPARIGLYRTRLGDQAFFLLAFIACTAMKRAATSLAKLADTAREEIPSTMAAIRLSGMEISDLTLELSDLSQEIADGVNKSAQAVQAAEAGIRQIGALARSTTISMIQERANLPNISLRPVVAGAAKKTSNAVGHAKKTFMNLISRVGDRSSDDEDGSDRVEY